MGQGHAAERRPTRSPAERGNEEKETLEPPLAPGGGPVILRAGSFHVSAGIASAVEDAPEMGVRVEVEEGETVGRAMRRLKKLKRYQLGWKAAFVPDYFVPRSEIRRKKEWRKLVLSSRQTYQAKRAGLQ